MKTKIAIVSNVVATQLMVESLNQRAHGVPGIGLIYGDPGLGKTTATAWLVNRCNGIYIRATSAMSLTQLLRQIVKELSGPDIYTREAMLNYIIEHMAISNRTLFIDEADYLLNDKNTLEIVRDIHDLTYCPVVLIGMESVRRKLQRHRQFYNRISEWLEFKPTQFEDLQIIVNAVIEPVLTIQDDLLKQLLSDTDGEVRRIITGLSKVEAFALANGLTSIDLQQWGSKEFFLKKA
ncbi:ATP-binding protein [Pseudoalteromonas sp. NEC-BIFX-2020_002]|uniref:AAA family ATPase n=1 Tax=Pseudoalteromonas sp. NEC-BIFX-2020_002 TaxID=2732353 RepID=UPI0014770D76|nr:ATP-binding protein [Pseudoalteromonas sp. NEC-BIFX-2020_002]NNG45006.1 ATP-binding protein [Pseudoalteromonas sp. NEC-BIFX-2020_002]